MVISTSTQTIIWTSWRVLNEQERNARSARAEQLRTLVGAAKGLADREMVMIHALGGSGPSGTTTGQIELFDTSPPRRQTLRAADVDSLRDKYGVDGQQFVVLLIGKDGGAKLRAEEPVTTTELFSLKGID